MQIDGFTVAAQIVNFLVLVALLKRFLYRPLTRAMEERARGIAARLEEAQARAAEAEAEARRLREERLAFEERREALLAAARAEAEAERRRLLDEARREGNEARRRWEEALLREREALAAELRRRVGSRVVAVARRVLADLAGADLEARVAEVFLGRLQTLDEGERRLLRDAWRASGLALAVRSAYPLPEELQVRIAGALRSMLGEDAEVRWETDPRLVLGLELAVPGRRWRWSVDGYLESLEETIEEALAKGV